MKGSTDFTKKHGDRAKPDPAIQQEIENRTKDGKLACAVAFDIASRLGVEAAAVGKTGDLMNVRLVKCQLGLFGYQPDKKKVKPIKDADPAIVAAIRSGLEAERLPCHTAWEIAKRFEVRKMTVSGVCEAIGIKIKPCQLGAF